MCITPAREWWQTETDSWLHSQCKPKCSRFSERSRPKTQGGGWRAGSVGKGTIHTNLTTPVPSPQPTQKVSCKGEHLQSQHSCGRVGARNSRIVVDRITETLRAASLKRVVQQQKRQGHSVSTKQRVASGVVP